MKALEHRIKIDASVGHVFDALVSEVGVKSWAISRIRYNAAMNSWECTGCGIAKMRWTIAAQVRPSEVIWRCVDGSKEIAGSTVHFWLIELPEARTQIDLLHTDWSPEARDTEEWNTTWGVLLHHLKNYAETEIADPAFE